MKLTNIIFSTPRYNQQHSAWMEHIPFAFFLMETVKPEVFVELGTHYGNSYFSFCQAVQNLKLNTKTFAVDNWTGDEHAGFYGHGVFQYVKNINEQSFSSFSRLLKMSFDEALLQFEKGSVDLLHIDGLHTYESVKHDFESWLPKMSTKGVVIFHDTNVHEKGFGVWRLMEEIKDRYPFTEFKHGYGLGILYVGSDKNSNLLNFIEAANQDDFIHKLFENMGKKVTLERETKMLTGKQASLQELIETQIQQIDKLKNEIIEKDGEILKKNNIINKKDNEITEKISTLNEKERTIVEKNRIIEKEKKKYLSIVNKLNDSLSEKDNLINQLKKETEKLNDELSVQKTRIIQKEKTISEITASLSWKITKPLRLFSVNNIRKIWLYDKNKKSIKRSKLFDKDYYLKNNPDVLNATIDPLDHFLKFGGFEGRNPSLEFDTKYYNHLYPDVVASGVNPLVHYIKYGKNENRKIIPAVENDHFFKIKIKLLGEDLDKYQNITDLSTNSIKLKQLLGDKFEGTSWPEEGETMIGYKRLTNLEECVTDVIKNDIPGDLIETGVWRGGACIFMKYILDAYKIKNKKVWVADSFEGLPPPDSDKHPHDKGINLFQSKELSVSIKEVKNNFLKYNLLDDRVGFIKGWFKNTLPEAPVTKLSVLRLDGDLYESTLDALINLYPKLSVGGYCIIDDWGAIEACKKAVEDFRKAFEITETIQVIDWTGVYWKKTKNTPPVSKKRFKQLISKSN